MLPEITFRTPSHAKVIVWCFKPSLWQYMFLSRIREPETESAKKDKKICLTTTVLKRTKKLILFSRFL